MDRSIVVNQADQNEERTTSSNYTGMKYSKKVNVDDGHCTKFDHLRMPTAHKISVIDLLGDGEPNSDTEEKSVHTQEAHVAFSVEGLGKMDAETPVQSPEIPGRFFLNGYSSPQKDRKSKHLNCDLDDLDFQLDFMTQDTDFSPNACPIKYPHSSIDAVNIASHPNHKFLNLGNYSPLNWNGSNLNGVYSNDELFCTSPGNGRTNWNGNLFKDNLDDIGQYASFSKNWVDQRNTGYGNTFSSKTHRNRDINFENWNIQDKRFSSKQVEMFDITESPPYPKYKNIDDLPDFKISDSRYSTSGIDVYAKDIINCFMREDTRESLSRLSEESCSSTAVKGDATKQSTSKNT